jgi:hypothetical protein
MKKYSWFHLAIIVSFWLVAKGDPFAGYQPDLGRDPAPCLEPPP